MNFKLTRYDFFMISITKIMVPLCNSPVFYYRWISVTKNCDSGIRGSENHVSGGPHVCEKFIFGPKSNLEIRNRLCFERPCYPICRLLCLVTASSSTFAESRLETSQSELLAA